MSRVYEGKLLCAKGGQREFSAKSMGVIPSLQKVPIENIYYEKITANLGRELFTKKFFPIISVFESQYGRKFYENNSIVDAAVVIQSDEEWGLMDDKDYLESCLENLMDDPQYASYLNLLQKAGSLNQPLSEALLNRAIYFKEQVQGGVQVNTMGSFAKKMIKSRRK